MTNRHYPGTQAPRYSRSEGVARLNPRPRASSSGSSSMNRSCTRTAQLMHDLGGHGSSSVDEIVRGADFIVSPHSAFTALSRVTACHFPPNSNQSGRFTR